MSPSRARARELRGARVSGAALAACALAAGCLKGYDPCLVPASVIVDNELRLLAVRADPPEVLVDLDAGGEAVVQVRALVVTTSGVQLTGRLCVPQDTGLCPDDGSLPQLGPPSPPGYDPTLEVRVPIDLVRAARDGDPLRGYGGIRVQLDVEVIGDHASVSGRKTLLFNPLDAVAKPNQPIELARLDFTVDGQPLDYATADRSVSLEVTKAYGLRPRLAPLPDGSPALEEFDVVDLSGRLLHLREQVDYAFFSGPEGLFGDLEGAGSQPQGVYIPGADLASEPAQGVPDPPNGLVRFNPLKNYYGSIWVVARESRGAVAWLRAGIGVADNRNCTQGCPVLFFGCD